jgi:hypothetical protein
VAWGGAAIAHADVVAVPPIVDMKGHARDILKGSFTLENRSGRYVELYPFVEDMAEQADAEADTPPLSRWMEFPRSSLIIKAGEKAQVEITVNINLRARPGIYHAVIAYARGSTPLEMAR